MWESKIYFTILLNKYKSTFNKFCKDGSTSKSHIKI